jgi:uncharacterized protein YmfQ (DUF2313 family)
MSETTYQGQPLCGLTGDDYAVVLADLLPRGRAWPRDPEAVIMLVMRGLAEEFARVTARDCDLLAESYPCGAEETLPDWERVCGLPDDCTGPLATIQQRQMAVCARLGAQGGSSKQFFIDLAASLGAQIEIETYEPFRVCQNSVGDPLFDEGWTFVWTVVVTGDVETIYFRSGVSRVGEPLEAWGDKLLECVLEAAKPAHTIMLWAYRTMDGSIWDGGASIWDGGASVWDV